MQEWEERMGWARTIVILGMVGASALGMAAEPFRPGSEESLHHFSRTFESGNSQRLPTTVTLSLRWNDGKVQIEYFVRAKQPVAELPKFLPNPFGNTRTDGTLVGRF